MEENRVLIQTYIPFRHLICDRLVWGKHFPFFNKGAVSTWSPLEWTVTSHHLKSHSQYGTDQKVGDKTIELLEINSRTMSHDLALRKDFHTEEQALIVIPHRLLPLQKAVAVGPRCLESQRAVGCQCCLYKHSIWPPTGFQIGQESRRGKEDAVTLH